MIINRVGTSIGFLKRNGLKITLEELINRKSVWSLSNEFIESQTSGTQSSMSDTPAYLSVCKLAYENDQIFDKFKSNREYRQILEHVTYEQGLAYLQIIEKDPFSFKLLRELSYFEDGKPFKYTYKKYGKLSPTLLRYIKVTGDIYSLIGNISHFNIAEIGVGTGGLCEQIVSNFDVNQYDLFDLPDVLRLSSKCISRGDIKGNINPRYDYTSSVEEYDLVISNYAFSELTRNIQIHYINEVILKSKHGYLIYNHISPDSYDSLSAADFCKIVPNAVIRPELPLTHKDNVLITW
jgi:hypothetical protein